MYLVKCLFILLLLCQCNYAADSSNFNPYEVLGLQRTASDQEIRQAYKRLARHWHPDKNSEPNAHDQFTKITAAYEILSDSTKKQNYDEYGTTSQENHRGFNTNHFRDPYDIFRAHFGGDFRFFQDPPTGAKKIIHTREFLSNILPNSDKKPYVLFGSTNLCLQCRQPLMIFRSLEKQFNDVGISTAEFNVNDQRLSNELGIFNSPSLCVISQRRVYHFNDHGRPSHYTEANIKEFVRKSMPIARYIRALETPDDIISLTSSYNQTNRVYAILITRQKSATLKFVIPCLQYTSRIQCAVFNSSVIMTSQLPAFLKQVSTTSDTVLFFKEDKNPVLVIREHELTFSHIQKTFESNQLLHLPIITSASVFNLVCKTNSPKPCFLIVGDPALFDEHRSSFLFLAKQLFQQYDTRMAYLDSSPTKQIGFSRLLASIYRPEERKLFIIVIRRWFDDTMELVNTEVEFDADSLSELKRNNFNLVADIEANLKLFLTTRWHNAKKHTLPPIFNLDEANENLLTMLINQILDKWNYWFERNHILRSLSEYVLTYQFGVILMVFVGSVCYMKYNPGTNDATRAKQPRKPPASPPSRKPSNAHREPAPMSKLKEFDELLLQRYVTPGAPNVIVLLLIADSPDDACIGHFNRHISAIHDSRMIFAVLYRDRSPLWLTELCSNIEDEQHQRTVRFTSSTVLALYIRRKFFVPYWSLSNNNEHVPDDAGAFLGMDHSDHQPRSSSTSSTDSMASTSESLSFSDWIDLLFDGNIRTPISVTEWPLIFR